MHYAAQAILDARKGPLEPNTEQPPAKLADIIEQVDGILLRYVAFPKDSLAILCAFWVANTYTYQAFRYCGYLALRSATPSCGKSLALELIATLSQGRPPITTMPTAAVLYRSESKILILDEVDNLRNADREKFSDVIGVLNSGFKSDGMVQRTNKQSLKVENFPAYGPKAFAGLERLSDTLTSRSFQIQMERSTKKMPRFNMRRFDTDADTITRNLSAWADRNQSRIEATYDRLPDEIPELVGFDHRFQDIAEPLLVLASFADAERPSEPLLRPRLITALRDAAGRRDISTRERQLLAFLGLVVPFLQGKEDVFIETDTLLERCTEREEFSFDRERGGRALSGFLKNFDLSPRHSPTGGKRGYLFTREWLETWQTRYQGGEQSASDGIPPLFAVKPSETLSQSGDEGLFHTSNEGEPKTQ